MNRRRKLSIVIPAYNEVENLRKIYDELKATVARSLSVYEVEILFMDNHSTDGSFELLCGIASSDTSVRVVRLSRNFGYQASILTGFRLCTGDGAVQLDADGEDDPALISEFVHQWELGRAVVYGVRTKRSESFLISVQRKIFYRIIHRISHFPLPVDAGDFCLIDRKVIDFLRGLKDAKPYLRGLIAYSGWPSVGIPYTRRPRYRGVSKLSWWSYAELAVDGICAFSHAPLSMLTIVGLAFVVVGALISFTSLSDRSVTLSIQIMLTGFQLFGLGVLGWYIARIFDQSLDRPLSIVEFDSARDARTEL